MQQTAQILPLPSRRIPHVADAKRPYKLWHSQKRRFFMWRYYLDKGRAMRSALWIAKWLAVGETVEVIDVRNGRLHGSYTRRVDTIAFHGETLKTSPERIQTQKGEPK